MTTAVGTRELQVPRARLQDEETGGAKEFRSELLPRYARRTREVDEAILATYLSGANSRRIRKALKPLLGEEHLSKSSVSRVVAKLKERFAEWQGRDLSEEVYPIVFLDGFHLKVRMAKRVVSVPVLAAVGVAPDGQKRLLTLRLAVSEGSVHWGSLVEDLQRRGLPAPRLVVSDGHKGLTKALEKWPESKLQRCVQHKAANLLEACQIFCVRAVSSRSRYSLMINRSSKRMANCVFARCQERGGLFHLASMFRSTRKMSLVAA